jgi:hypothetical protein
MAEVQMRFRGVHTLGLSQRLSQRLRQRPSHRPGGYGVGRERVTKKRIFTCEHISVLVDV